MSRLRAILRRLLSRRGLSTAAGVLVLAAFVGGLILYGARSDRRGDSTEFDPARGPSGVIDNRARQGDGTVAALSPWPMWGRSPERTRFAVAAAGRVLRPPYTQQWVVRMHALMEFPPVLDASGDMYIGGGDGLVRSVEVATGRQRWATHTTGPIASSPLFYRNHLYVAEMDGFLYSLHPDTGQLEWRIKVASRLESSPLAAGGRIVLGTNDGEVQAIDVNTHRTVWTARTDDRVKAAPALYGRTVYVGTYGGRVYAFNVRTGAPVWVTQTRRDFAFSGTLYSTPAVAYGRVYVGSTDGRVYSLGATSGKVIWVHSTGDWVYGSPAVANQRVFVGSYDRTFYALDARSGDVRWTFRPDGRISGSATVIGDVVYFSTLSGTTYGLSTRNGKVLWTFPDGRYTPVITDGTRMYLTGKTREYAFAPAAAGGSSGSTTAVKGLTPSASKPITRP